MHTNRLVEIVRKRVDRVPADGAVISRLEPRTASSPFTPGRRKLARDTTKASPHLDKGHRDNTCLCLTTRDFFPSRVVFHSNPRPLNPKVIFGTSRVALFADEPSLGTLLHLQGLTRLIRLSQERLRKGVLFVYTPESIAHYEVLAAHYRKFAPESETDPSRPSSSHRHFWCTVGVR